MTQFIDNLKRFNRKERFYIVGWALGNETFAISSQFRKYLSDLFDGLDIPENPFAAMDFHLDWIYASAFLSSSESTKSPTVNGVKIHTIMKDYITATQEDVDFLIAFPDSALPSLSHLIMIETKGDTSFTNEQLASKADRLRAIFGDNGARWKDIVVPHFAITSPKQPTARLKTAGLPTFMLKDDKLPWFPLLSWQQQQGLQKITRCDSSAKDSDNGPFWKVEGIICI